MDIIKITKEYRRYNGINPTSKLTRLEGFKFEKKCLQLLNLKFKCICGLNCNHFPILKDYNEKEFKLVLSNCGISIRDYKNTWTLLKNNKVKTKKYSLKNPIKQIDCIIFNLKRCKIKHLDLKEEAKNICINKDGILSVIDFDIGSIHSKNHKDIQFYNNLRNNLIHIVNSLQYYN